MPTNIVCVCGPQVRVLFLESNRTISSRTETEIWILGVFHRYFNFPLHVAHLGNQVKELERCLKTSGTLCPCVVHRVDSSVQRCLRFVPKWIHFEYEFQLLMYAGHITAIPHYSLAVTWQIAFLRIRLEMLVITLMLSNVDQGWRRALLLKTLTALNWNRI